MIAFNLHEYLKNRCHFKWKLWHREDTAHGHLGLGRTNFMTSNSISLIYINGILIMSVPWGRNFDIALILSPSSLIPFTEQECVSIIPSTRLFCVSLLFHSQWCSHASPFLLPGPVHHSSVFWLSPCLRRGESEEAGRLVPPKKPIHHIFPLLKYHYSPYNSNQKDTSLECFTI